MSEASRQTIRQLFNSSVSDQNLVYEFNLFDRSVTQKLWSTEYYCSQLTSLDINSYWRQPSASETQFAGSITTQAPTIDIDGYCLDLNRLLDGFFMNSMSVLDTLAHQLSTLYDFQHKPPDIYIVTIKDMLLANHPNSEVGTLLDNRLGQDWFSEFRPFRHCTTHESLIVSEITTSYDQINSRYRSSEIKLPDDPQVRPFTDSRNREALSYCQSVLGNIQSLVGEVYDKLVLDIYRANNVLPIPMS